MDARPEDALQAFPTIVISDVHLGTPHTHADRLLGLLSALDPDHLARIIINGDLIDGDYFLRRKKASPIKLPEIQMQVLDALLDLQERGVDMIWIPGNHDALLREEHFYSALHWGFEIKPYYAQVIGNQKIIYAHGDEFADLLPDTLPHHMSHHVLHFMVSTADRLSLWASGNRYSFARAAIAGRSWLANRFKTCVTSPDNFAFSAARKAHAAGSNMVVTGHIHCPQTEKIGDDVLYVNSGDFMHNASAVGIDEDGRPSLIDCFDGAASLPASDDNRFSAMRPRTLEMINDWNDIWPALGFFAHPNTVLNGNHSPPKEWNPDWLHRTF